MALKAAVIQIWKSERDFTLAARLSSLIMSTAPKPQDWVSRWEAGPPPEWVDAVNRIVIASLAIPIELTDQKTETAYNEWVERHYLEPLRSVWPERYRAVVEQTRSFIFNTEDDDDQEKEEASKPARKTQAPRTKDRRKKGKARRKGRS
jgi:hypothetical protein